MKSKPAGHVKKNDKLIFISEDGLTRNQETVVNVQEYDLDPQKVKLSFPAKYKKLQDGSKVEVSPKANLVLDRFEQVNYEG